MILLESEQTENYLENLVLHKFSESMSIAECGAEILCEMEREWNSIIQSQAISMLAEQVAILEEGEEAAASEESKEESKKGIHKIIDTIIGALKKFASWIGGFFAKVWEFIDKNAFSARKMIKDKAACEKGAAALEEQKKTISVYKETNKEIKNPSAKWVNKNSATAKYVVKLNDQIKSVIKASADDVKKYIDEHESRLKNLKAAALGKNISGGNGEDFDKKLKYKFELKKEDAKITKTLLNESFTFCSEGYKKAKADAKKAYNDCKTSINASIKAANGLKKEIDKKDEDVKSRKQCISIYTAELKAFISCTTKINKEYFAFLSKKLNSAQSVVYACYKAGTISDKKAGKKDAEEAVSAQGESAIDFGSGFSINLL